MIQILIDQENKGEVALIATSGFRAILLAAELGDKRNKNIIPKIILVDNSKQVQEVWLTMCAL